MARTPIPSAIPTLAEAAREVEMPATIHFQRRAVAWLNELRNFAQRTGLSRLAVGGASFEPFDLLRQPIVINSGNHLANLTLLREIARRHGPHPKLAQMSEEAAVVLEVCPELAQATDRPPLRSSMRTMAWRAKRALQTRTMTGAGRIGPKTGRRQLAVPLTTMHVADMLPEAAQLRDRHGIETVFGLLDRRLAPAIENAGYPWIGLMQSRLGDGLRALALVSEQKRLSVLAQALSRSIPGFDAEERRLLLHATLRALGDELRRAALLAAAFGAVLRRLQPDLVRVGNPFVLDGRVAARACEQAGIPTVVVEHGVIFANDPKWQDCPVTLMCAWGQPSRRSLLANGMPDEQIAITGSPRFDEIFAKFAAPERSPTDDDCILVAASGPGDQTRLEHHQAFIRILLEAIERTPHIRWRAKLHPKDNAAYYRTTPPNRLELVEADRSRDGVQIFELLGHARATVTERSSAAVDAMALGVPVIALNIWPEGKGISGIEFLERGCTRMVRTSQELAQQADRAWRGVADPDSDRAAQEYVQEHLANRGRAAQAVADRVSRLWEHPA